VRGRAGRIAVLILLGIIVLALIATSVLPSG
jgi:hypothetical protein